VVKFVKKVLIANRGAIAARIIRACKAEQIETVAIYSEADKTLPYVNMADESYEIGQAPVQQSYLKMDTIIDLAKKVGVDAIHPGYGFLSENPSFVRACEKENITFIGPDANVIEQMGDKIKARQLMQQANVPVIPGTDHQITSATDAKNAAKKLGYPVLLKASAGGGGIGMQVVHEDSELEEAFISTGKRAAQFFGNDAVFVEKVITNARHIEVQIAADIHGNVIHLYERDCSIQRRNQKVIEEAPANICDHLRNKLTTYAIRAAKEINYTNVGTIEFLVDDNENVYFLEMNTRLQVEHGITEEITGVDLARLQLLIARGERIPFMQDDVTMNGHAIEARIYAEDSKTFFPSPGKITTYKEPKGEGIRMEATVTDDTEVTPFYDPMISKLIVHGNTREEAIEKLQRALHSYKIEGIKTNIPMLQTISTLAPFLRAKITTDFITNQYIPTLKK